MSVCICILDFWTSIYKTDWFYTQITWMNHFRDILGFLFRGKAHIKSSCLFWIIMLSKITIYIFHINDQQICGTKMNWENCNLEERFQKFSLEEEVGKFDALNHYCLLEILTCIDTITWKTFSNSLNYLCVSATYHLRWTTWC